MTINNFEDYDIPKALERQHNDFSILSWQLQFIAVALIAIAAKCSLEEAASRIFGLEDDIKRAKEKWMGNLRR